MAVKKVNFQIEVPTGKHCTQGGLNTCEHLDSNGYNTGCSLRLGYLEEDKNGWELKPKKCIELIAIQ